jgi:hypothetical protein
LGRGRFWRHAQRRRGGKCAQLRCLRTLLMLAKGLPLGLLRRLVSCQALAPKLQLEQ